VIALGAKANPGPVVAVAGIGSSAYSAGGGASLLVWKNGTEGCVERVQRVLGQFDHCGRVTVFVQSDQRAIEQRPIGTHVDGALGGAQHHRVEPLSEPRIPRA
jgi:hypothetical protein